MRIDRDVAVIVCAGPSLDRLSPAAWREIEGAGAVVAVNGASAAECCQRYAVRFSLIAAMDVGQGLFDRVPRLANIWSTTPAWRATSVDARATPAESYVLEVDEEDGVDGWSDHPDGGYKGGSTGMIIGNWIGNRWPDAGGEERNGKPLHPRGFRRIAYVGLDMNPGDGRHAKGAGLHASGFSLCGDRYRSVSRSWGKLCEQAARRGIEIVNLTPDSGLVDMPREDVPKEWISA